MNFDGFKNLLWFKGEQRNGAVTEKCEAKEELYFLGSMFYAMRMIQ
jgi:hypothetical protein